MAMDAPYKAVLEEAMRRVREDLDQVLVRCMAQYEAERHRLRQQVSQLESRLGVAGVRSPALPEPDAELPPPPSLPPATPPLPPAADVKAAARDLDAARVEVNWEMDYSTTAGLDLPPPTQRAALLSANAAAQQPAFPLSPSMGKADSWELMDLKSSDRDPSKQPTESSCGSGASQARSDSSSKRARRPSIGTNNTMPDSLNVVLHRLQVRLGHMTTHAMISGEDIYHAVYALGLERYSVEDMMQLVHRLGMVIELQLPEMDHAPTNSSVDRKALARLGSTVPRGVQEKMPRSGSKGKQRDQSAPEVSHMPSRAHWTWPDPEQVGGDSVKRKLSNFTGQSSGVVKGGMPVMEEIRHRKLPLQALMKALMAEDLQLRRLLGGQMADQLFAIKEVLLTGDTNRLVAELTCVRIDDLATRKPKKEPSLFVEPLVGLIVILNGLSVGAQTDPKYEDWDGWFAVETAFTMFFFMEIVGRCIFFGGVRTYVLGEDRNWHAFEVVLVGLGILDFLMSVTNAAQFTSPVILRFLRLARVSRLVRVLRLKFMAELNLMIKGVLSGIRTLFWAFILLLFVVYVLGVTATATFAHSEREQVKELFHSVPESMFTAFRCVSGECLAMDSTPLPHLLLLDYGVPFAVVYVASFMIVSLGIFNVILAIYVEITMAAAKQTEEFNKGRQDGESIRIAHITKRLLRMFCAAHKYSSLAAAAEKGGRFDMRDCLQHADAEGMEVDDVVITKEIFLLVIQDKKAQKLMDDLDIPAERAILFDSIDATGAGCLYVTELVMGLLKVRGELKKSDQVACILALRATQNMLRQIDATMQENDRSIMEHLGIPYTPPARSVHWRPSITGRMGGL